MTPLVKTESPVRLRLGRWRDLGLAAKLVLAGSVVTALVVGTAFVGLRFETRTRTRQLFAAELARSQQTIAALQTQRIRDLVWTASLVSRSPTLRASMETYRAEPDRPADREQLLATITRSVESNLASLDHDLLVVVGQDGKILAAAARGSAPPLAGQDLSDAPTVRAALDPNAPSQSGSALLDLRGAHFQVVCAPIELTGYSIGALILGDRLVETFVQRIASTFNGSIVVATPDSILTSTLKDPIPVAELVDATRELPGRIVESAGEELAVAALPLGVDGSGRPVVVYFLDSVTRAVSSIEAVTRRQFFLIGSLAMILVGIAAAWLARAVLDPMSRFVEFLRSVAGTRDYSVRFDAIDAGPEIKSLNASYDSLIESLQRERAELVSRSNELALTNEALWEQMRERERIQRALEESEKQLRQSQKLEAVGTLAGGVAHDFNNLLTVIIGHTEMLLEASDREARHRRDIEQIRAAADRAASLTRQLLAFSRKQLLKPKTLDLVAVVEGMGTFIRRLIGEDIDLKTKLPKEPAWVVADPTQLEQVVLNLAVNARDAMPKGGVLTIEVTLEPRDGRTTFLSAAGGIIELSVRDSGVGMDEITKERIFEPFFTTKGPGRGTGLGLSTVYGIVEQSGGEIEVDSAPGRGTEFRIRFPRVVPAAAPPNESDAGLGSSGQGHETILVVEDEEDVRQLAARALAQHGYVVLEAANGSEALEIAHRYRGTINLLLADVVMPGMNGKDVRDRMVETRPKIRTVYMSGYPADIIANRGLLESETEFIQKPFTPSILVQRIRAALDGGRELSGATA